MGSRIAREAGRRKTESGEQNSEGGGEEKDRESGEQNSEGGGEEKDRESGEQKSEGGGEEKDRERVGSRIAREAGRRKTEREWGAE